MMPAKARCLPSARFFHSHVASFGTKHRPPARHFSCTRCQLKHNACHLPGFYHSHTASDGTVRAYLPGRIRSRLTKPHLPLFQPADKPRPQWHGLFWPHSKPHALATDSVALLSSLTPYESAMLPIHHRPQGGGDSLLLSQARGKVPCFGRVQRGLDVY